jgi:CDGSH-type Zn-finger protein
MSDQNNVSLTGKKRISIVKNGPYKVFGRVPLVHKTQVVSEHGEPLTWKKDGDIKTEAEVYSLCRCGKSDEMPFCDGCHKKIKFDGTELAKTDGSPNFQITFPKGTHLIVRKDPSLCMNSGYCGMKNASLAKIIGDSNDTMARSLAIAMVERCPSGSLTYKIEKGDADIEPDLPQQIADTTEITSDGPITGPLWVSGCIQIERSDGKPFVERNRITLCNCGLSENKPLCDGTHRIVAQQLAKENNQNNT